MVLKVVPPPRLLQHWICRRKATTIANFAATAAVKQPASSSAGLLASSSSSSSLSKIFHPRFILSHNPASASLLRSIHCTPPTSTQITINVPTMGDSITEGTIVEWCVPTGTRVREGDVLALVETDKVTVDIKADREGILVKQLGELEGVVEVGQGLYVLDTDVTGNVGGAALDVVDVSAVNASLDAEKMVAETPSLTSSSLPSSSSLSLSSLGERVPSIHFLGKEGWKERRSAQSHDSTTTTTTTSTSTTKIIPTLNNNPKSPTSITYIPYSAMYGRPPIMDDEMEALILGGAEEAPEVISSDKGGWRGVTFVGGKISTAGPRGVWLAE